MLFGVCGMPRFVPGLVARVGEPIEVVLRPYPQDSTTNRFLASSRFINSFAAAASSPPSLIAIWRRASRVAAGTCYRLTTENVRTALPP